MAQGTAEDSPDTPLRRILVKLVSGALRRDRHEKTRGGLGDGQPCDGCDRPVMESELDIEVDFSDRQRLRFHRGCFSIWQAETRAARNGLTGDLTRAGR